MMPVEAQQMLQLTKKLEKRNVMLNVMLSIISQNVIVNSPL